ncbi:G-type lectin S-receptor-like serine/threonine-protein kinase [Tanacetum coccineum]
MSPEYAMGGVISEKSDVFSYGVMLLEIVSGKRNTAFIHQEQVYPLAHDLAMDRPMMTEVVSMLCSDIDLPQPKEPLFSLQRLSGNSIGQESANMCSNNIVTISMVEGR